MGGRTALDYYYYYYFVQAFINDLVDDPLDVLGYLPGGTSSFDLQS